jgi:hypothetical protein
MTQYRQQAAIAKPYIHVTITQMSIKKGIKKFGDALLKELSQLHEWDALMPKIKKEMKYD